MGFFQLECDPESDAPPRCPAALRGVWKLYRELDRTQRLEPSRIEAAQLRLVRRLLAHCVAHVPYYRRVFTEHGVRPDSIRSLDEFRRVPRLPRRTYQQNLKEMVAEALPPGHEATSSHTTSGSSGSPTRVYQTNVVNLWWFAFAMRDMEWCGFDPTCTLAAIRSTGAKGDELSPAMRGLKKEAWLKSLAPLFRQGPAHLMDITQDHRRQLEFLRSADPAYLVSYPANLEVLAAMAGGDGKLLPRLRMIQSISDTLTEEARRTIESGFGVPVKNVYSSMEVGYIASPCPEHDRLHVHAENVLMEVLDEQGNPCPAGVTGDVYVTCLHNYRAPFVRYQLGDRVTMGEACPCGRGLPVLQKVHGKEMPQFHLPGGGRIDTTRLAFLLRKIGDHFQHQAAQTAPDRVVVRIVPAPTWTDGHGEKVKKEAGEFFGPKMRIDLELHDELPTPSSGKFQNMVVEMDR